MNPQRLTPRYIIKTAKVKEKILKTAREKESYTREPSKGSADFSDQCKFCRPKGSGMIYLKCCNEETYSLGYSTHQGCSELKERESFPDKQKLRVHQY